MKKLVFAACMMVFFAGVSVAQTNPTKKAHTKTEVQHKDSVSSTTTPGGKHKMVHHKSHKMKTKTQ